MYGAGCVGKLWYDCLVEYIDITGFIDNNPQKQNDGYLGLPVFSVENFNKIKTDDTVVMVCIGDTVEKNKIIKQMEKQCGLKNNEQIFDINNFLDELPVDKYLSIIYKKIQKSVLFIDKPITYNEKLKNKILVLYECDIFYNALNIVNVDFLPFYKYWYDKINEYHKIIILDAFLLCTTSKMRQMLLDAKNASKYLCLLNSMKMWETLETESKASVEAKAFFSHQSKGYKIYSYDENDCKKHNFYFNTTFYDKSIKLKELKICYDIVFLGALKDRAKKLTEVNSLLVKEKLKSYFGVICYENHSKYSLPFKLHPPMQYNEYLNLVAQSKCILDLSSYDQIGFSLRVMEAIFFNKKLITDNPAVKTASFYNPNNIYILDGEDNRSIKNFLDLKFENYPDSLRCYYSVEEWIKRFD